MSSIKILQKGITDIQADAIVNAANSVFWAVAFAGFGRIINNVK